jgi:hypothetical protein
MSLRQRAIFFLQLREQADVLDGDDGLVGEGLQQRDLTLREGPGCPARHGDHADGVALMHHRHGNDRTKIDATICLARGWLQSLSVDVRDVH